MRAARFATTTCLVLAGLGACAGSDVAPEGGRDAASDPDVSLIETGTTATDLARTIRDRIDPDADLSVFVLDGETVTIDGPTDRRYSFDSITKTVVGLILAELVGRGEVALETPIGDVLDAGENGDITFEALATHSSGLPRLAPNADEWDGFTIDDPYAGFTAEMAEEGLRQAARGEGVLYSNFGFQLLGLGLERSSSQTLGDLATTHVFGPAEMPTAALPQQPTTLADGIADGDAVQAWSEQLGGAGGVEGTIEDLVAYARYLLDPPSEHTATVIDALLPRTRDAAGSIGLAWVHTDGYIWHNGGSAAYASILVLDPTHDRAAGFLTATGHAGPTAEQSVFAFLDRIADG